jgi:general secretion pathway protein A
MYLNHYNLTTRPFQISTDPRFLWLGEKHREAMAVLRYGILDNKGFLLLTGEVGTGKTTLIHALVNALRDDVIIANVPDPGLETMEFYAYIARAFHLSNGFKTKYEFLSIFGDFLHRAYAEKKQVLLILDESQRMGQVLLEEIRLLSNIEKQFTKLINIFFVGQAEFNNIILETRNSALRQRITVNYNLGPISAKETDLYVRHRLKVAGTEKRIFTSKAIKEIHAFSEGYPRLINVICDRALVTGYANGTKTISRAVIKECADEMRFHQAGNQKKIAAAHRKKKEPSLVTGNKEARRPAKPGLYVLLAVLVTTWVGIAVYVYSPESRQKLIMMFNGRSMTSTPAEIQSVPPSKQLEPATTIAQPQENPVPTVMPESVQQEQSQVVLDRDVALHVAFNEHNDLTTEAYQMLDKLAMVMTNEPSLEITIKGYSKGLGSIQYPKKMSEFSANIAKGYLVGKGIKSERIHTMGITLMGSEESNALSNDEKEQSWVEILLEGGQ